MYLANVGGATYGNQQRVTRDPQQGVNQGRTPQAATQNPPTTTQNNPYVPVQGDVFEQIQNDTRQGAYQDLFSIPNNGGDHFFRDTEDNQQIPANLQALLDKYGKYGLTAQYMDNHPDYGKGWSVTSDTTKLVEGMPQSKFGEYRNLAPLSSDDRNNVRDPRYVYFDPNYGWVTHRKNYDQNADSNWFMRNAKTIVPTLATMGLGALGVPSMVLSGIGAGRGLVDIAAGNAPWESIIPSVIGAGMNLTGLNSYLGSLAPWVRGAVNYGVGQAVRRGN